MVRSLVPHLDAVVDVVPHLVVHPVVLPTTESEVPLSRHRNLAQSRHLAHFEARPARGVDAVHGRDGRGQDVEDGEGDELAIEIVHPVMRAVVVVW